MEVLTWLFTAHTINIQHHHRQSREHDFKMPAEKDNSGKQFSFDVVACLLAALGESNVTVGNQHYKIMAKIDDSRTFSGYEHLFRPIKARAKEISDMIKKGELGDLSSVPPKKAKKEGAGANGEKKGTKRGKCLQRSPCIAHDILIVLEGRKAKSEEEDAGSDDGVETKKIKREPVADGGDADANGVTDASG